MNLGQAKELAFRYANEYSVNGTAVSNTNGNYIDIKNRMYAPANTAQMRLADILGITGVYSISQNPIDNLLGTDSFDEQQHFPGTNDTYESVGAKSMSFEVDKACTITIEEYEGSAWQNLTGTYYNETTTSAFTGTITVSTTTFLNIRAQWTLTTATNNVRITITPTYPMKSRYRSMFAYTFANASSIPWYRAYVPYDLPTDYWKFGKMLRSYDQSQYEENKDYIRTSDNKIYINWFLTGQFDIYYKKYPTEITTSTLDSYEFEVPLESQALIPWFMAGQAIMPDDRSIGTQLLNQYYSMESQLSSEEPETQESIEDTDGW